MEIGRTRAAGGSQRGVKVAVAAARGGREKKKRHGKLFKRELLATMRSRARHIRARKSEAATK